MEEWPQKLSGDKIAFAALQLKTKIDFDVLWFRRTRAHKISKKKKEKKLIAAKNGLVGIKGYLKTYNNPVKYFLPCLSRFSIRPLFIPNFYNRNFRHGFQVLKPKSRDSLPQNLAQTYN